MLLPKLNLFWILRFSNLSVCLALNSKYVKFSYRLSVQGLKGTLKDRVQERENTKSISSCGYIKSIGKIADKTVTSLNCTSFKIFPTVVPEARNDHDIEPRTGDTFKTSGFILCVFILIKLKAPNMHTLMLRLKLNLFSILRFSKHCSEF